MNKPFEKHNQPLYEEMIQKGYTFKRENGKAFFVDRFDNYISFPTGYITGPIHSVNSLIYASVYNGTSWHQYQDADPQVVIDKALAKGKELLNHESSRSL